MSGALGQERAILAVLVRGTGDVGSSVAHRLFSSGYAVVMHDGPAPAATRRKMAFVDAIFDGRAVLDGLTAVRVDDLRDLRGVVATGDVIPVVVSDLAALLEILQPDILVDARMRKRARPEAQLGLAPLTIGLGPNFVAGETTDLAVETGWGDDLGKVYDRGSTRPLEGEPNPIEGHSRDRYVYAPIEGIFSTRLQVGQSVRAGDPVATVGPVALSAPLDGVLRGLTRDGVRVSVGTKVIEVDPRGERAVFTGIGERPGRIAEGVLRAIRAWETQADNGGITPSL